MPATRITDITPVVAPVVKRKYSSKEERRRIAEETLAPGASVAVVARGAADPGLRQRRIGPSLIRKEELWMFQRFGCLRFSFAEASAKSRASDSLGISRPAKAANR
jgi:hypothetical protein